MMIGGGLLFAGLLCMEIAPYFYPPIQAMSGSAPIALELKACDIAARFITPLGFLCFSIGYAMDSSGVAKE